MPTTLPVPSKGALRALRNLALGTSCTLALSAGLLTEDRRRRIHAAREVHNNAKKLKSSSKYHATGTTAIEAFEGQPLRHQKEPFCLPSNVSKSTVPRGVIDAVERDGSEGQDHSQSSTAPLPHLISRYKIQPPKLPFCPPMETKNSKQPLDSNLLAPPAVPKQKLHNRQHKLAADVTKLLEKSENSDEAASRFFEAFEEGLSIDGFGILQPLIDAAVRLAHACEAQLKFASSDRVFDIILGMGTLREEDFNLFHPEAVINRLLERPSSSDLKSLDPEKLRKASSIFLTTFKEKPKAMSIRMQDLGEELCVETCQLGMYDLTLEIYSRMESTRGDGPPRAVGHLINAVHMKGEHTKMFRYFHKFCTQTTPHQFEFYDVGNLAFDSILTTGNIDQAEQALVAAAQVAEKGVFLTSTTWFCKVLGYEWRTHRNLERTTALFKRLEPLVHFTQHPPAVYGAMIQFCIEANDEPLALSYFETMRKSYAPSPRDRRIYGHFALAKAMRNDWAGVEDDFRKMRNTSSEGQAEEELSASFAPILKIYVQSHSVGDIEEFIRLYIDGLGIKVTAPLMNIMVDVYGNAKEIDSLFGWIDYAAAAGSPIDSVTFNTILNKCSRKWGFSFWEVFRVYKSVSELGPGHSNFCDEDTVPILRRIAMLGIPPQEELMRRLEVLKKIDNKSVDASDSTNVLRAMATTLAEENPIATLEIYSRALQDNVFIETKHLTLAVKASLQLHGDDVEETTRHIQDAQRMGIDVGPAIAQIFSHEMSTTYQEGNSGTQQLTELTQRTISALEQCGMTVPARIITHVASILERQGHHQLSVQVWNSWSSHLDLQPSSLDLVTLTVLVKAYIGLRDCIGIRWVVKTLSDNNIVPDAHFRLLLKNARRSTRTLLKSSSYPDGTQQLMDTLVEALETTRLLRAEAIDDTKNVKFKTIKIIEQAIADQAGMGSLGVLDNLEVDENLKEGVVEISSKISSAELGEPWMAEELEEADGAHHGVEIPCRKLVGMAAG